MPVLGKEETEAADAVATQGSTSRYLGWRAQLEISVTELTSPVTELEISVTDEVARMEGAGILRIWRRVALPLVKPTTSAIALLALVTFWSNFIDPLLYLSSEQDLTAPPMIHHLELLGPTNWPVFLAGSLVVTMPVVLAFLVAQRFFWSQERGTGWLGR